MRNVFCRPVLRWLPRGRCPRYLARPRLGAAPVTTSPKGPVTDFTHSHITTNVSTIAARPIKLEGLF